MEWLLYVYIPKVQADALRQVLSGLFLMLIIWSAFKGNQEYSVTPWYSNKSFHQVCEM